ncbi:MAG TPA: hypothetical protein PLV61_15450 [Parvularculaceae bacterium]|nr:hypothetical protein [Parvularculaceae bacterium]
MPNAPVRQSQITRAVKAVQAAGVPVGRVEIAPNGTVNIYTGAEKIDSDDQALDEWVRRNARKD